MVKYFSILSFIIYTSVALSINAEEFAIHDNKGIYGRVEMGVVVFSSTDQLFSLSDKNKKTNTINGKADVFYNMWPIAAIDLRYAFKKNKELYLGTPFLDDGREGLTFGIKQSFNTRDLIDVSVFAGGKYVWEDPYLLYLKREKTEVFNLGSTFEYHNIGNTYCSFYYRYKNVDVKNDIIGEKYTELKRDGMIHTIGVNYEISRSHHHYYITPGFSFSKGDMDGKSNSYNNYTADFSYSWEDNGYAIDVMWAVGKSDYDAVHPLFFKTREEYIYYGSFIFTVFDMFDINGLYGRIGIGYENTDSNIIFLDCHTAIGGVSLGFFF